MPEGFLDFIAALFYIICFVLGLIIGYKIREYERYHFRTGRRR